MAKAGIIFAAGALTLLAAYFGKASLERYIDQQSGEIVEHQLAINTINQLKLIESIKKLIDRGDAFAASEKLQEASDTFRYILEINCSLEECREALDELGDSDF